MEWSGALFATATVITIALGHHFVRKINYLYGTWPSVPVMVLGAAIFGYSFFVPSNIVSGLLGIIGLTTIVDGIEIIKQEKRIQKGFAPMNPNRPVKPLKK